MSRQALEAALKILPAQISQYIYAAVDLSEEQLEEIHLRVDQPLSILTNQRELIWEEKRVSTSEIQFIFDRAVEYSVYSHVTSIRNGFLPLRGGCRIGLCGSAVYSRGEISTIHELSSLNIRIPSERCGIAEGLSDQLFEGTAFLNTLIIAPPGAGKTTLLRDLIRTLSDGCSSHSGKRIAVIDEREEVAACIGGVPQFKIGTRTDILSGIRKADGILMLLRTMNPEIIALDEITAAEDINAMLVAAHCGVHFIATIHGDDPSALEKRPLYQTLKEAGIFSRYILVEREGEARKFQVVLCS